MSKIIISGHGQYSIGLLNAFHMIFGENNGYCAVPFLKGEGIPQLQAKIATAVDDFKTEEPILIMVDIFGGTPYNAATQWIYDKPEMDVISGTNLPLLLEAATDLNENDIQQLVSDLLTAVPETVVDFSEKIQAIKTQNDEEEDDLL
uniref:EIIA-man n=1 Tax=Latilactobacillus curvatus TaxID=28038 RepID=Q48519_LATCU|nr:EIIA-man [Latilactobacillus curvatus]